MMTSASLLGPIGTTEVDAGRAGYNPGNTRDPVVTRVIPDTRVQGLLSPLDFSPRELEQISESLLDIRAGRYRSFDNTEDLFAYLDSE